MDGPYVHHIISDTRKWPNWFRVRIITQFNYHGSVVHSIHVNRPEYANVPEQQVLVKSTALLPLAEVIKKVDGDLNNKVRPVWVGLPQPIDVRKLRQNIVDFVAKNSNRLKYDDDSPRNVIKFWGIGADVFEPEDYETYGQLSEAELKSIHHFEYGDKKHAIDLAKKVKNTFPEINRVDVVDDGTVWLTVELPN